ncbi:MAG: 30S ribosomal protein S1, partial [Deltaproteobacteria bacterium]
MEELIKDDVTEQSAQNEVPEAVVTPEENAAQPGTDDAEMESSTDEPGAQETMESLMDMYEESFKRFGEGEVVTGRIISVDKDYVLVDIGYKSEGQIRINEFKDEEGNVNAKVDDTVEVMVEWWDEEDEVVVLSKEKAAKVKVWEEIKKAYDDDGIIDGVITNRV